MNRAALDDDECGEGSWCINERCCYAVAWDGSCCESGQCDKPAECNTDAGCEAGEQCEDGECIVVEPLSTCDTMGDLATSTSIPGIAGVVAVAIAESDGTAGLELIALSSTAVTIADGVETGTPSLTTVALTGSQWSGLVAFDLDGDGLDDLLLVDDSGTVAALQAEGANDYTEVQSVDTALRPPLAVADVGGASGPELLGLSDDGYTVLSTAGVGVVPPGVAAPDGVADDVYSLDVGTMLAAAEPSDVVVADASGVVVIGEAGPEVRRIDFGDLPTRACRCR